METIGYLVLVIVGFIVVIQLYAWIGSYLKKGKQLEGIEGDLGRKISRGDKVMVYFYSQSCSACKPMTPVIDKLRKSYKNVYKVNVTKDLDTSRKFGVMGTPAMVLVENAKISEYILGARNETFIQNLLA
jgi:thioredoxin 1